MQDEIMIIWQIRGYRDRKVYIEQRQFEMTVAKTAGWIADYAS